MRLASPNFSFLKVELNWSGQKVVDSEVNISMMSKNGLNARVRDRKIKWLRKQREVAQYLSVVPRPQRVRMLWLNELEKEKI
jgi:hypothetical protein